jgi:hypothetical protein
MRELAVKASGSDRLSRVGATALLGPVRLASVRLASVRLASVLLASALLASVGGCTATSHGTKGNSTAQAVKAQGKPAATRTAAPLPAFDAGGACQLLDYGTIQQKTGLVFSVAAAAQQGDTFTCLVQPSGVNYPDLALSVTATTADEKVFQTVVMPAGSAKVDGLGKIAYTVPLPVAGEAGPGVQVGWLAANKRLMVLRLRLVATAQPEETASLGPKMVELAKTIELTSS